MFRLGICVFYMGALRSGSGFRAVRDYRVIIWERFAGIRGTRVTVSKTNPLSSRTFADSDVTSLRMKSTSRGLRTCSRNMRRQVCGLAAVIQARIGRWTRVRAAGSVCSFSRGGRKTMVFLALFHVKQSRFRTADPHRSASRCHSEEPATKNLRTWRIGWP